MSRKVIETYFGDCNVRLIVTGNVALLVGPSGSGKTAMVFALAAELGFKVLEVNASSNRTGKQVMTSYLKC